MSPVLIIDPGHGGSDPGGGSNSYWQEKNLVLDISMYQFTRFQELGVSAALTRNKDVYIAPTERARMVRESAADYCISNHINAGGGDGAEIIYSIHTNDTLAVKLAEEIRKEGQNIRRVFTRTLPNDPRKDYYFMHRETGAVETMIIEYGFADSRQDDVEQLRHHWKEFAEAVVRGFCRHIGHPYRLPDGRETGLPKIDAIVTAEVRGQIFEALAVDGKTYVEIRKLCEDIYGDHVIWDAENRKVIVTERK